MKRQLLVAEFLSTPWALMPERLAAFAGVVARWSAEVHASPDTLAAVAADREARDAKRTAGARAGGGGIAVIPLYGVVTRLIGFSDTASSPDSNSHEVRS